MGEVTDILLSKIIVRPKCRLCEVTMCRQTTSQGRQGSIIQSRSKGTGRQAGSDTGRMVRQGQDRKGSKTRRTIKREAGKRQELTGRKLVSLTNKKNWQQTNREHRSK
jgi:hypothetical protein